jgi:spore maturation protein CgeB
MNILFSGYHNPLFLTVTEYIEDAFRSLGHRLSVFDPRRKLVPARLRQWFPLLERIDRKRSMSTLLSLVRSSKPQAAIFSGGFFIDNDVLRAIADTGCTTVLWTTDAPHDTFKQLIEAAPLYRHIFCQGTEAVELFAKAGIARARWLPMACDLQHHHPVSLSPEEMKRYGHDIVFVGSYYPNRWAILKELTGFSVGIYGPHWNTVRPEWPAGFSLHDVHLPPSEWLRLYCAAKIVIVVHYQDDQYPCYQASPKVFETLAAGCFVLVDRQKDVFTLFRDNEHLVGFDDATDLRKKIAYYLEHGEERQRIACNGRRFVIENHTYLHRVKTVMPFLHQDTTIFPA